MTLPRLRSLPYAVPTGYVFINIAIVLTIVNAYCVSLRVILKNLIGFGIRFIQDLPDLPKTVNKSCLHHEMLNKCSEQHFSA